jgi:hypothetical protein
MLNIKRRIERLEEVAATKRITGKHSLEIHLKEGDRCDIALQRGLDEKGISLKDVGFLTFTGGLFFRYERDLQNHPGWELLQALKKEGRLWTVQIVNSKAEYQEYLRWEQEQKANEARTVQDTSPRIQGNVTHTKAFGSRRNHLQRIR